MQPDTRKLLRTGTLIFGTGAIAVLLMFTLFGGVTRQGPHTNLGCLPTGCLTLLLGLLKLLGDLRR